MLDYIHEGPSSLERTLADNFSVVDDLAQWARSQTLGAFLLTGLGSSYLAEVAALPTFLHWLEIPTMALPTTEIIGLDHKWLNPTTVGVFASRSGERKWVVNGLRHASERGMRTVAMTGVVDSLMAQKTDKLFVTSEGPEITFPKTKSVLCTLGALLHLALALSPDGSDAKSKRLNDLKRVPDLVAQVIATVEERVADLVPSFAAHNHVMIAGSMGNIGVALEAALKIQETVSISAQGADTGMLLHGATCGIDESWLIVLLATKSDEILSRETAIVAKSMQAKVLCITEPGLDISDVADYQIQLPTLVTSEFMPLVYLPTVQLLTYYWAVERGLDPDKPRGMSTVLGTILPLGRDEPEFRK